MADVPSTGSMTITEKAGVVSITRTDPTGMLERLAAISGTGLRMTTVLNLDGSESKDIRGQFEIFKSARWSDGQLVVWTRWSSGEREPSEAWAVYSLEGADLRVEHIGRNRIVLFYKKAAV